MGLKNIFVIVLTCFLLVGCERVRQEKSPYPVIDSQAIAVPDNPTFWLDNNRVIYTGREGEIPKTRKESIGRPAGIYIWDIEANTVTKHASLAPRYSKSHLCYAEGRIYYTVEFRGFGKEETFRFGPLGQEKEYVIESKLGGLGLQDEINCQIGLTIRKPSKEQHRKELLHPEHGYLDYGPYGQLKLNDFPPLYYVRDKDKKRILLPWRGSLTMPGIRYYPFKNAYLIKLDHWDEKNQVGVDPNYNEVPQPLRWLYPDGKTEEVSLPWVPWQKSGSLMFYGTREGYFVVSHSAPKHGGGGYLYRDGQYQKVISGYLDGMSISPDGCRAAFTYSKDSWTSGKTGRSTITTLNVIDFCAGDRGKTDGN